jgi:chitin disaccharide deacetylase
MQMNFPDSKIIINADDYGLNSNTNAAIVYCLRNNIINSTTIMVNTSGFLEAVEMAEKYKLKNQIGIHINLTEGKPLSDLSLTGLTDENGNFIRKSMSSPKVYISSAVRLKVKSEIKQQYEKLLDYKINPTHIDSHHSIHVNPWISGIFTEFANERKQKIRISNDRFRKNLIFLAYYKRLNKIYKRNKINFSDEFATVNSFIKYFKSNETHLTYEIMVHPSYEDGILIDTVDHVIFEDSIKMLLNKYNFILNIENKFDLNQLA